MKQVIKLYIIAGFILSINQFTYGLAAWAIDFETLADSVNKGQELLVKGDFSQAEQTLSQALEKTHESTDIKPLCDAMILLIKTYSYETKYKEAFSTANKAVALTKTYLGKNDALYAKALCSLADLQMQRDEYAESIKTSNLALNLIENDNNATDTKISCLCILGSSQANLGDYFLAEASANKSLDIAKQQSAKSKNKNHNLANSWLTIGLVKQKSSHYTDLEAPAKQVLAIKPLDITDRLGISTAHLMLADVYDTHCNNTAAKKEGALAVAMRKEILGESHPLVAYALQIEASDIMSDELAEAERCVKEALSIDSKFTDEAALAFDYKRLSEVYMMQLRPGPAYKAAEEALELASKAIGENSPTVGKILLIQYNLDSICGQTKHAEETLSKVLVIARSPKNANTGLELNALEALAHSLEQKGNYNQALDLKKDILSKTERLYGINSRRYELSLKSLADCYTTLGQYQDAYEIDKKRLPIGKRLYGDTSVRIVDVYSKMGNLESKLYSGRYSANNLPPSKVRALMIAQNTNSNKGMYAGPEAKLMLELNPTAALKMIPTIIKNIAEKEVKYGKESPMLAPNLNTLGQLYFDDKKYLKSEECFKRAIDIIDGAIGSIVPPPQPFSFVSSFLSDLQKERLKNQSDYDKALAAAKNASEGSPVK